MSLTAAEIEMLGLPVGVRLRAPLVGWRVDEKHLVAYAQLADGSEGPQIDLVPLLAFMERAQRSG